jgi:hypothetical protein
MAVRVLNKYRDVIPPDAIWIMRPNILGNPFIIGRDGTRDEVCDKYEEWAPTQPEVMAAIQATRGHSVVCCCEPQRCHGRTIVKLANPAEVHNEPDLASRPHCSDPERSRNGMAPIG